MTGRDTLIDSVDGYRFKPHEMPILPGSPANPDHPPGRRAAYLAKGVFMALVGGAQPLREVASVRDVARGRGVPGSAVQLVRVGRHARESMRRVPARRCGWPHIAVLPLRGTARRRTGGSPRRPVRRVTDGDH